MFDIIYLRIIIRGYGDGLVIFIVTKKNGKKKVKIKR